jgi:hypothetical protein
MAVVGIWEDGDATASSTKTRPHFVEFQLTEVWNRLRRKMELLRAGVSMRVAWRQVYRIEVGSDIPLSIRRLQERQ